MGLKEDLKRLKPGDTLTLPPEVRGLGKVTGLKGEPGRPITLEGPARILSSGIRDVANLRLEESSHVVIRNLTLAEATMDEARALDLRDCDNIILEDLAFGPNIWLDHCHLVGCRAVSIRRFSHNGAGGKGGRGGQIGSHAIYVAEGCSGITVEDVDAVGLQGAPVQVNAEDGAITGVLFRRVWCVGWQLGAGFNLVGSVSVALEDISLNSKSGNGGIRCSSGARATLTRYAITLRSGVPALEGTVQAEKGTPQPPRLDTADPPPPPPDTDLRARLDAVTRERDAALAKLAQVHALTAPG